MFFVFVIFLTAIFLFSFKVIIRTVIIKNLIISFSEKVGIFVNFYLDKIDRALTELNALAEQYYLIEQKSQTLRLNLRSVCYFKSEKRTIYAFSKQNHETSFYGKLEEVSAEMPSFFQRIHNRYLVNLNYVTKLDKNTCICNGEELPVSRAYKQELSVAFARMMLK